MENLTENNIKITVLKFLKAHYKHRTRAGETIAKIDMQGEGGIIADGYLKFTTDENKPFLATFEATSFDSKEELFFSRENDKLYWDSLALSFLFSTLCLAIVHSMGIYPAQKFMFLPAVGIGIMVMVIFFYFYRYIFKTFSISRYRYIYAIEQFKRYFADEQWIAFAEDVFPNQDDKYFKELKHQCFRLGIGLIIVNRNLACRFVATPSIHNLSLTNRETIRFSMKEKPGQKAGNNYLGTLKGTLLYWLNPYRTIDLFRFKKVPFHQFTLVVISLIIILTLLIFELYNGPVKIIADQEAYNKALAEHGRNARSEPLSYIVDTPLEPGEFELQKEKAKNEIDKLFSAKVPTDIIISDARKEAFLYYDCSRFANYSGKYYIVQDTILFTFGETMQRIRKLKEYGMDATAIWRGCFQGYGTGYLIYFDEIYPDTSSTRAELEATYLRTFFSSATIDSPAKVTRLEIK